MKNICSAGEIIYGHPDFRSDLYLTLCFRTPSLPTFSRSRVSIWRWYLSLGGGAYFYLPGQRDFPWGEKESFAMFSWWQMVKVLNLLCSNLFLLIISVRYLKKNKSPCDMFSYLMALEAKWNLLYHKHISQNHIGHFKTVKLFSIFSSNTWLTNAEINFFASFNNSKMYFRHGSEGFTREKTNSKYP
jgi:hypothetical protein